MAERQPCEMAKRLSEVPDRTLLLQSHAPGRAFHAETAPCPEGKGLTESWIVFPGIVLTHSLYQAKHLSRSLYDAAMQLSHCRLGRICWKLRNGAHISLGPWDLSFHRTDACAESVLDLPLGYYEGIALTIDLKAAEQPEILREAGIGQLDEKLSGPGRILPANPRIDRVFFELYSPPQCLPYFRLKVQELLLLLTMTEPEGKRYPSQQIEVVRAVHRQLTGNLDQRFTIEELSRQYLMNTASLKAVFKSVYGKPIAAYMREYRMRKAAQLLRETRDSVAEVARQVGYENQSKFTAAFREVFQLPPAAYRRLHQI